MVVGLPLNMDGSDGPSAQSARAFGRNWAGHSALPLSFWDERLSTSAKPVPFGSRCLPGPAGGKWWTKWLPPTFCDPRARLGLGTAMRSDTSPVRFAGCRWPASAGGNGTCGRKRIFLLVGIAALFAGFDMNVFGLAIPQIHSSACIFRKTRFSGPHCLHFPPLLPIMALSDFRLRRSGRPPPPAADHHYRPGDLHLGHRLLCRLFPIRRSPDPDLRLRLCR